MSGSWLGDMPAAMTGHVIYQPMPNQTRSDYYFDASLNYQEQGGCLDAPTLLPRGGMRSYASEQVSFAISYFEREGQ